MFLLAFSGTSNEIQPRRQEWSDRCLFFFTSSFLKRSGEPNIPIQAIGLSLYEDLGRGDPEEVPGTKVTRTQWLDMSSLEMANLIGKNILIVDEVDDTRTTLEYAVRELQKDVEIAQKQLGREGEKTNFFVFVLHVCVFLPNAQRLYEEFRGSQL
jgi:hypoxanthine phosphoribosyltransferase